MDDVSEPDPEPPKGQQPPPPPDRERTSDLLDLMTIGFGGAVCLVLAGGIGFAVDAAAHTSPIFTFVGIAFGLVTGVAYTVNKVKRNL